MNKILKIVFIVLIILTVGELAFYIYQQKFSSKITPSTSQTAETLEPLIKPDTISYLQSLKESPNRRFYLLTNESGIVDDIKFDQQYDSYILKIVDENGNKVVTMIISTDKIDSRRIFEQTGEEKKSIKFNDIKTNDRIIIKTLTPLDETSLTNQEMPLELTDYNEILILH